MAFGRAASEDHGADAQECRGQEMAGNRADRGENRPPVGGGGGGAGLKDAELVAPHQVRGGQDAQGDRDDGGGRGVGEPAHRQARERGDQEPEGSQRLRKWGADRAQTCRALFGLGMGRLKFFLRHDGVLSGRTILRSTGYSYDLIMG